MASHLDVATSQTDAIAFLDFHEVGVVAVHLGMPEGDLEDLGWEGIELSEAASRIRVVKWLESVDFVRYILERWPRLWIIMTGPGYPDLLAEALRVGVRDYVVDDDEHPRSETYRAMVDAIRSAARRS